MTSTWLITGTSSGFGRLMTEQLLERGDRVAATLRRPERLDDLVARHGDRLWVRALDVTDRPRVGAVVDEAFAALGRIDVVVSNAGYALVGAAEEATDEQLERQLETNVLGPIRLVRAALPHLRAQGGGRILQLASNAGHVGYPGAAYYSASKFAVVGFFEALRTEVAPFGIGTTLVEPGGARTDFAGSSEVAPALAAYAGTPAAASRAMMADFATIAGGDPARMAAAMIEAAEAAEAPARLVLGSDAYASMAAALGERLAQVEAQRESAARTDVAQAG